MRADTLITFAYGSNMLAARLRERCPSAEPLGIAELSSHRLRWHKKSKDGSGKCDIVLLESPEAPVLGVLFQIANTEKEALDRAEGLGHGYKEIQVRPIYDGKTITARAYQATEIDYSLTPYTWYRELVLEGAKENRLPEEYFAQLLAVSVMEDPDQERHQRNMKLIRQVDA